MSATTIQVPEPADVAWRMSPSKTSVVKAVTRRMVPYLVEATLIPTVLFYVFFITLGLVWAIIAAVGWTYAAVGWRVITGRSVPALLMLATLGISLRTGVYLLSSNSFVYFVQPIVRTVATGAFFAMSVIVGRPLIARFAADFCHLSSDVASQPEVVRLFRRLTYLWAGVNALSAAVSLAALDGAGCRVRRRGDRFGLGDHVQRCGADGVGFGSNGPPRRAVDGGCPQRETARRRHPSRLTSCAVR